MRFVIKEITPHRVFDAFKRRVLDIPNSMSWHFSSDNKNNINNLHNYYNIHKNERCFIIANGPSLMKMDLSCLRNEYTFSMNRAYLLYNEWRFDPNYFVY